MHNIISYSPGQLATVTLPVFDGYGALANATSTPTVVSILFPNSTLAAGFPVNMTKVGTGLYQYKFVLPSSASAVGSYVINMLYLDVASGLSRNSITEIQVNVPFGNFSITPG